MTNEELNRAVAVEVMGYPEHRGNGGVMYWVEDEEYRFIREQSLYKPSESMADAWQVVEKFTNDGWCPGLIFDDDGRWALSFVGVQNVNLTDGPIDMSISFLAIVSMLGSGRIDACSIRRA